MSTKLSLTELNKQLNKEEIERQKAIKEKLVKDKQIIKK